MQSRICGMESCICKKEGMELLIKFFKFHSHIITSQKFHIFHIVKTAQKL